MTRCPLSGSEAGKRQADEASNNGSTMGERRHYGNGRANGPNIQQWPSKPSNTADIESIFCRITSIYEDTFPSFSIPLSASNSFRSVGNEKNKNVFLRKLKMFLLPSTMQRSTERKLKRENCLKENLTDN